jgi:uncharacterized protein YdeI (YjbR/CyaY-like superfamily)
MKTFKARLKKLGSSPGNNSGELGWRIVDVPFDVKKAFGKGGTVPVHGTVNGLPFRTSLFPRKEGRHFLLVNKKMRDGAGVKELGDTIEVSVELDTKKRTVEIPSILKKELEDEPELLAYLKSFSYSMRKYFADHVMQPKGADVRKRRAQDLAATLLEMKDGETTPPPILEAEFAHNPKARLGWQKMPPSHRRSHLWGIAYYKTPEARQKRVEKAIAMMVEYAGKQTKIKD